MGGYVACVCKCVNHYILLTMGDVGVCFVR